MAANDRTFNNAATPYYLSCMPGAMSVGWSHVASGWHDLAHTQIVEYTNSIFRTFLHFDTSALNGHHLAKAQLNLHVNTKPLCITQYGNADAGYKSGQRLEIGMPMPATSSVLDVTKLVQSWADSPGPNAGAFALQGDEGVDMYHIVSINTTCVTQLQSPTLDVTYY